MLAALAMPNGVALRYGVNQSEAIQKEGIRSGRGIAY